MLNNNNQRQGKWSSSISREVTVQNARRQNKQRKHKTLSLYRPIGRICRHSKDPDVLAAIAAVQARKLVLSN